MLLEGEKSCGRDAKCLAESRGRGCQWNGREVQIRWQQEVTLSKGMKESVLRISAGDKGRSVS